MFKLSKSTRKDKKYMADFGDKVVHFGAAGYEDYTIHKDDKRKADYLARHHKENWTDYTSAGSLSRWLLWNKPTLSESIKDYEIRSGFRRKY